MAAFYMSLRTWTAVDKYVIEKLLRSDQGLDKALERSAEAGLPPINVSPPQGMLLMILARSIGAKRILEVGTLGGYSTIWLARALPQGGRLISLEIDEKHVEVARANVADAGLSEVVEIREGPALEILPELEVERAGPFDLFFIDADKPSNPEYFEWAVRLSRPGSLIIVDNVIREGEVIDAKSRDPNVEGVRRLNDVMASEHRVIATEIQTVGAKGYDGFAIAFVIEEKAAKQKRF